MLKYIVRRKLPLHQVIVASIAGVLAGVYIWKPVFDKTVGREEPAADTDTSVIEVKASTPAE